MVLLVLGGCLKASVAGASPLEMFKSENCPPPNPNERMVCLMGKYPDNLTEYATQQQVSDHMQEAVKFWIENSYGVLKSVSFEVYGYFTTEANFSGDQTAIMDAVIKAANPTVDFRKYDRILVFAGDPDRPNSSAGHSALITEEGQQITLPCGFINTERTILTLPSMSGFTVMGVQMDEQPMYKTICHESGHNWGLGHANLANSFTDPSVEYEDIVSVMGSYNMCTYSSHHNAYMKELLGWLKEGNVKVVTEPGTHEIYPLESWNDDEIKVLKIKRPDGSYIYVEFRQPIGSDADLNKAAPDVFKGALIHIKDLSRAISSTLINCHPGSQSFSPQLNVGEKLLDITSGIGISVESIESQADPKNSRIKMAISFGEEIPLYINYPDEFPMRLGFSCLSVVSAVGGVPPYKFFYEGALPPGINFYDPLFDGTPTEAGSFMGTIKVVDQSGKTATKKVTFIVDQLKINPTLIKWYAQENNVTTLEAVVGSPPFAFSMTNNPSWLNLSSGGLLSGVPPAVGTSEFVVDVKSSSGAYGSNKVTIEAFSSNISIEGEDKIVALLGKSLSVDGKGIRYKALGGIPYYSWSHEGQLPAGVTQDKIYADGRINGTPTQAGVFPITLKVTDAGRKSATKKVTFIVNLQINPTLIKWYAKENNVTTLESAGAPPFTFSMTNNPSWLNLSSGGLLSGVPPAVGTSEFEVTVTDARGAQGNQKITLMANEFKFSLGPSLIKWCVGVSNKSGLYLSNLQYFVPPYTFSISNNPSWLSFSSYDQYCVLSGVPPAVGTSEFEVTVTDARGAQGNQKITLEVSNLSIDYPDEFPMSLGEWYFSDVDATGGGPPYSFSYDGVLPPGIKFSCYPGGHGPTEEEFVFYGIPTQTGTFEGIIKVRDYFGQSATKEVTFKVYEHLKITTPKELTVTHQYWAWNQILTAEGGVKPYAWYFNGTYPDWLFLDPASGKLWGTPQDVGNYKFNVGVKDSINSNTEESFSLQVVPTLKITTEALPSGMVGETYLDGNGKQVVLCANGGVPPYKWSENGNARDYGLVLHYLGSFGGAPFKEGLCYFQAKVTDAANENQSSLKNLSIKIDTGRPVIQTTSLPNGKVAKQYTAQLTAFGGVGSCQWEKTAGGLPAGLQMDSNGGITGIPRKANTNPPLFYVKAIDSRGIESKEKPLKIVIETLR